MISTCSSRLIHGWFGKIHWNIITWQRRFLQSTKYGRYNVADYTHAKRACKDFEIKNVEEYNDLYVQSDTLLLADVLQKFCNMCPEIYKFYPARFHSAPELAWQAISFKNAESKIKSFNWYSTCY